MLTISVDFVLFIIAVLSALCTFSLYAPRRFRNPVESFGLFALSAISSEMAPLWLLLQVGLTSILMTNFAFTSSLGWVSAFILIASWAGLAASIRTSLRSEEVVEAALASALGQSYLNALSESRRNVLGSGLSWSDWFNPVGFGKSDFEVIRDISYLPGGVRNQLDIYRPHHIPEGGCPVLMQIHGGAWMIGKKGRQALALMKLLTRSGWICVDVHYRLSPNVGMPTHIQDCKAALCWIRQNGAEYGMDTDFVAVTGGSAGGHLSSLMAVTANMPELQPGMEDIDTSVQACVPFYGPQDLTYRFNQISKSEAAQEWLTGVVLHESPQQNPALWELVSPLSHIDDKAPPYMVLHGDHDSVVPVRDDQIFVEELRRVSKNPVVYAELPGADHAFDIINSIRTRHAINGVHRFLEWARCTSRDRTGL